MTPVVPLKSQAVSSPDIFFVCPPRYFQVVYAINGHMHEGKLEWQKNSQKIFTDIQALWKQGVEEITARKAHLITIKPDPNCPDQVFAADPLLSFITDAGQKIALMSHMRHSERQLEVSHARRAAQKAGFQIVESSCIREGSGDTLFDPNYGIWFAGVGQRTDIGAGQQLQKLSGRPVIEIPTTNEHFFHLDTFMAFLPKGHVLLYKQAMTPEAYRLVSSLYPKEKRYEIDQTAAMKFAANLQIIANPSQEGRQDHTLLMSADCPSSLTNHLQAWGYKVQPIEIHAARHAGGGIHCCFHRVCDLRQYPQLPLPAEALATNLTVWGQELIQLQSRKSRMKITARAEL